MADMMEKPLNGAGLAELWGLIGEKYPKMVTGSYTGNGNEGASYPNSLTLPFTPKLMLIHGPDGGGGTTNPWFMAMLTLSHVDTTMVKCGGGDDHSSVTASKTIYAKFTDATKKTVQWYASTDYAQMNKSNTTYYYVAIG